MENRQKMKMLRLVDILQRETDENHMISTREIIKRLNEIGITCDRRSVPRDMALLREEGFDVHTVQVKKEHKYYMTVGNLSVPELKILIDAVQAAKFITNEKTEELVEKLTSLCGSQRSEILQCNKLRFRLNNHTNEDIFANINAIENAIFNKKRITFHYFHLNENGQRLYRYNKGLYKADPIILKYNEDNYYLIAYSLKDKEIRYYRVDRMCDIKVKDDPISDETLQIEDKVYEDSEQAVKMYGGEPETVTLKFTNDVIEAIFDQFGEKTKITRIDESLCSAEIKVQISPTFWGWLTQFAGKISILSPLRIKNQYLKVLKSAEEIP